MKIDKNMNLVIPVTRSDGVDIFVHSTPISALIFEKYYRPLAEAFNYLHTHQLWMATGPRIAFLTLKDKSEQLGLWDGQDGVERGLMAEIHRLTNVMVTGDKGWETIPFDEAVKRNMVEKEDVSEVDNRIIFFTLGYSLHNRKDRWDMLDVPLTLWGAQIVSLNCTAYLNSLKTSTEGGNSGVTAAA